ncbi:MAGa7180 family putative nuclease [Mycoplasma todarodis]|uniref:YqaJ viral recombinase domain-containing protein n=1 Tax=Mycoplasma todarodis TaxID=1937191 RepID=A0A4R0XM86_9MOLU|nr:hypothetical protein [Mycoplasma todarodis]TCG11820.1 hypothetical protein C4B25_00685 [Mycoplasma todarodis]
MNIKRHFYNGREYSLDTEQKVLKLLPNFHEKLKNKNLWGRFGFKKMGGSSVGDVLETDQFKSPFKAFARMSWLDMPILNKKYINAGVAVEPKVLDLIRSQPGVQSVQGFDAKEYNYDYFAGKDDIIGGLPDGLAQPGNVVIEVKTAGAKKLEQWKRFGVPEAYLKQAQLYTYLMGLETYAIVGTFLEEEDYALPELYPIQERKTKTWPFRINRTQVEDDINTVKTWYRKYTSAGVSPQYDERRDKDLIDFLLCRDEQEWKELQEKWLIQGKIDISTL